MRTFIRTLTLSLLCILSTFILASAAVIDDARSRKHIAFRQTTTGTPLNEGQACAQYSRIANLSVIGANSTYRSAFLEASPVGTLQNSAMMNKAIQDNPPLMLDPALNTACGNATEVAIAEAANNFSRNVVAEFAFVDNPSSGEVGPIVMVVVAQCALIFGVFTAL
ncbi:unnamed protein product [Discula destructiva]